MICWTEHSKTNKAFNDYLNLDKRVIKNYWDTHEFLNFGKLLPVEVFYDFLDIKYPYDHYLFYSSFCHNASALCFKTIKTSIMTKEANKMLRPNLMLCKWYSATSVYPLRKVEKNNTVKNKSKCDLKLLSFMF